MRLTAKRSIAFPLLILAFAVGGAGCARKAVLSAPKAAAAPPLSMARPEPAVPPVQREAPAPATPAAVTSGELEDAHFDFDQSILRQDARDALDADAKLLRDHPGVRITIEGHCDERGTVEYNQALGDRRANVAREYLVSSGVSDSVIATISYGKDRPFCSEHTESCWAKNRCAHMLLRNGPA